MDIRVNRQSVCMGDDVENHTVVYTVTSFSTKLSDVFRDLIDQKYFPNISGNDVVWTLYYDEDDVISWKTKENKLYDRFASKEPAVFSLQPCSRPTIQFRYYSSPLKRAQHIFLLFNGMKSHIQQQGYMPEYESYCVPKAVEDDWEKYLHEK